MLSRERAEDRPAELNIATADMKRLIMERDFRGALNRFEEVTNPDVILYNCALDACAKALLHREAWTLWGKMTCSKTAISYNTMVDLCKRVKHVEAAEELVTEMRQSKLEPNSITYSSLIGAYS